MIETNRFGHGGGRNMDWFLGDDAEDFMDGIEADEMADDGEEDHEQALDAWREQQDADGGDELECGLSRHQLRVAAKVLFHGLAEVIGNILSRAKSRISEDGDVHGCMVSGSQVAGLAVALQLPGFQKGAEVARRLNTTRAGVSFWSAEYGRRMGVTSQQSAKKQRDGILAKARVKAKLPPSKGGVGLHTRTVEDREPEQVKVWLESLTPEERLEARRALGLKKAV